MVTMRKFNCILLLQLLNDITFQMCARSLFDFGIKVQESMGKNKAFNINASDITSCIKRAAHSEKGSMNYLHQ